MGSLDRFMGFTKKVGHTLPDKQFRKINDTRLFIQGCLSRLTPNSRAIGKIQRQALEESYSKQTKSLIIFLTPGTDIINGGILSVASLYRETKSLKNIHRSETILCTYPRDSKLLKYTKFQNDNMLFDFGQTSNYFSNLENLVIHVPEHYVDWFFWLTSRQVKKIIASIKNVQINILIQNVEQLPSQNMLLRLRRLGSLTATTAHTKYSTPQMRQWLGFPLHKLSVYVSPQQYVRREYGEKEDLLIVSPDPSPHRSAILQLIKNGLPDLRLKVIQGMTYDQYKQTISRAKWALTFGEGLDGYFVESIFSGAISFSVYNPQFFTAEFHGLQTVYDSYDQLASKFCSDIKKLDNVNAYTRYQKKLFDLCAKEYRYENYVRNLALFYEGKYTLS